MIQMNRAKFWDLTGTQLLRKLDIRDKFGVYAKIQVDGLVHHIVQKRDISCRPHVEIGVDFYTGRAIFRGGGSSKIGTFRNVRSLPR